MLGGPGPDRRRAALALAAILVVTGALYAPSLGNDFAYDDEYVARAMHPNGRPNPLVAELRSPAEYFRASYWKGEHDARVEYRPATIWSYAAVYAVWGRHATREAFPQHLLNWVLHLVATALVYRLLRAARAARLPALAGAAVFGLHAIHSEVVASVVGRAELLGFGLGAIGSLIAVGRLTSLRVSGVLVCWFLAFASKENALAWVPWLAVLGWVRSAAGGGLDGRTARGWLGRAAALGALPVVLFLWLRADVLATLPPAPIASAASNPLASLAAGARIVGALPIWAIALGKTLLPTGLASDYGRAVFDVVQAPGDLRFLAAAAGLGVLGVAGLLALPRHPLLFLAVASFFGLSFATSNLPIAIGTIFGERLLYAPSLAASAAAAWLAARASETRARTAALAAVAAAWALWCGALILERNAVWSDNESLYLADVAIQPRSIRLQILASDVYAARGDTERQFEHLGRAFALGEHETRSWTRLALLMLDQRRYGEATRAARRGLAASSVQGAELRFLLRWALAESLRQSGHTADDGLRDDVLLRAYRRLREDPAALERLLSTPLDAASAPGPWLEIAERVARDSPRESERALRLGLAASVRSPIGARFRLFWALSGHLTDPTRSDELASVLASARAADPVAFDEAMAKLDPQDPRRDLPGG